jgi:ubiquinone/menaquinone biosynthesis C-methylase UbiE
MAAVDWDEVAERFDDAFCKDPVYTESLETMVEKVTDIEGKRLLDLGCGTGNLISFLLERFPQVEIVGLDPSAGMREVAARRFSDHPNVSISTGDALDIPFPDDYFHYVMSNLALHHVLPDARGMCAGEIGRVLKTGGKLIYSDVFCGVDGPPEDPDRCRDIIEKITAKALYSLEHGAYKLMLAELEAIPKAIRKEEDYLTTPEVWMEALERAGFSGFEVIDIPPIDLTKIIRCELKG